MDKVTIDAARHAAGAATVGTTQLAPVASELRGWRQWHRTCAAGASGIGAARLAPRRHAAMRRITRSARSTHAEVAKAP